MASGYKLNNGNDLSTIFESGNSYPSVITGYTTQTGSDISSLFAAGSSSSVITGYKLNNGNDIATVFKLRLTPLDVAGCCLWMDASDPATITQTSGKVSKWTDKSTNNYTLNQSTSGNQPSYNTTNLLNGLSTIKFTSSSSTYLTGDTNANSFAVGTKCYSIFAVCKYSTTGSGYIFAKSRASTGSGRILFGRDVSTLYIQFPHDGGSLSTVSDASYTNNTYRILELIINRVSGKDYIYQNGTQIGTTFSYTPDTSVNYSNSYKMLIGAYNDSAGSGLLSGYYLNGDVAEIVSFANSYDMTDATRQWIEGYLAWKWGLSSALPTGHTYKSSAPSSPPP